MVLDMHPWSKQMFLEGHLHVSTMLLQWTLDDIPTTCPKTKLQLFECPQEDFLMDITKEIKSWQEMGDHLIVLLALTLHSTGGWPS